MNDRLQYDTLRTDSTFELRQYKSMLVAKVLVDGPFERAFKSGEQILKEYFEGGNLSHEKFPAPARYMLKSRPDGWEVSCELPKHLTLETAPRALNSKVKVDALKPRPVAVTKFNGKLPYSYLMKKTEELRFWAKANDLLLGSGPRIVISRAPFLPFLRKNEIQLDELT